MQITPGITCGPDGRAPCALPFASAVRRKPSKARDRSGRQVDALVMLREDIGVFNGCHAHAYVRRSEGTVALLSEG